MKKVKQGTSVKIKYYKYFGFLRSQIAWNFAKLVTVHKISKKAFPELDPFTKSLKHVI